MLLFQDFQPRNKIYSTLMSY
uniref:Uncharacterized protein n=1 Tax=Rhizophora mucronata TaxID=61149 RepID=A0A2P2LSK0_RHIMU